MLVPAKEDEVLKLWEVYSGGDPLRKTLVELLTFIYTPTTQEKFFDYFHHFCDETGLFDSHSERVKKRFSVSIESLVNKGLILKKNGNLEVNERIRDKIALTVGKRGRMNEITGSILSFDYPFGLRLAENVDITSRQEVVRLLRILFFGREPKKVSELIDYVSNEWSYPEGKHPVYLAFSGAYSSVYLSRISMELLGRIAGIFLRSRQYYFEEINEVLLLLGEYRPWGKVKPDPLMEFDLFREFIFRGDLDRAKRISLIGGDPVSCFARGVCQIICGKSRDGIELFERGWTIFQNTNSWYRYDDFIGFCLPFYGMGLLRDPEEQKVFHFCRLLITVEAFFSRECEVLLSYVALGMEKAITDLNLLGRQRDEKENILVFLQALALREDYFWKTSFENIDTENKLRKIEFGAVHLLFYFLSKFWLENTLSQGELESLKFLAKRTEESELGWIASEAASLLAVLGKDESYKKHAEVLHKKNGTASVIKPVGKEEVWNRSLKALEQLGNVAGGAVTETERPQSNYRLAWIIYIVEAVDEDCNFEIRALEQKRTKRGSWSKGRLVANARLFKEGCIMDSAQAQDLRVIGFLREVTRGYHYYYSDSEYVFERSKAIMEMIGHPHVLFGFNEREPVELVQGKTELWVTEVDDEQFSLECHPRLNVDTAGAYVRREKKGLVKVYNVTEESAKIEKIVGSGLTLPKSAKDELISVISQLSSIVTIQSVVGGGEEELGRVEGVSDPVIQLTSLTVGLHVELLVRPFGNEGPSFEPGYGGVSVFAEIKGERSVAKRSISLERERAEEVVEECDILCDTREAEWSWDLEAVEDCLELLLQLQELGDRVTVEWPKGEKYSVKKEVGSSSFRGGIRRKKDWFGISGELEVDEKEVLGLQRLIELSRQANGRFVQLSSGDYVALSDQLRNSIRALDNFSTSTKKGELSFHPAAALALEEITDGLEQLKVDKQWKEQLKRIRELDNLRPNAPSMLKAELRDYQVEGFRWLARLQHWGVGACLADDMGLGKTVQALTMLLRCASKGPSLVVAPLSVCMNWEDEIARFTPTLQFKKLATKGREEILDSLGKFDVLVCSYGLLFSFGKKLAEIDWNIVVLDEAQAIKNMASKRSKAAMELRAEFKMILTGTPIENHLGELWNLFRFINPGLLGSLEQFNKKFANPIEKYENKEVAGRLQQLIRPFILRRTKSQVLEELPSRTEIPIHVELSEEERSFYEALRRDALKTLQESDGTSHVQIFAELMKLRRCCCHPSLVLKDTPIAGSKLKVFREILAELLENKHKVLVFSQFVDHLKILKRYLEKEEIAYQYLDGSTPAKARKKNVDAFQAGEGDVFLISLKAGGSGLNLTAADYVIHMDPWWNPAVEDQASDRAHRIGQIRPVTIYRLITSDTIEERILSLHKEKRELADNLLDGTDAGGKISVDELMNLLRD